MDLNIVFDHLKQQMPPAAAAAWRSRILQSQNGASQADLVQKIHSFLNSQNCGNVSSAAAAASFGSPTSKPGSMSALDSSMQNALQPDGNKLYQDQNSGFNNASNVPLSHALFRQSLAPLVPNSSANESAGNENPSPISILAGPESPVSLLAQAMSSKVSLPSGASNNLPSMMDINTLVKMQLMQQDRSNSMYNSVSDMKNSSLSGNFDSMPGLMSGDQVMPDMNVNRNQLIQQLVNMHRSFQNQQMAMQGRQQQQQQQQLLQQVDSNYFQNQNSINQDILQSGMMAQSQRMSGMDSMRLSESSDDMKMLQGELNLDSLDAAIWANDQNEGMNQRFDDKVLLAPEHWDNPLAEAIDWQTMANSINSMDSKFCDLGAANAGRYEHISTSYNPSTVPSPTASTSVVPTLHGGPSFSQSHEAAKSNENANANLNNKHVKSHSGADCHLKLSANSGRNKNDISLSKLDPRKILSQIPTRRKRGAATDMQSLAARARRERITRKMRTLHELVPGGRHLDTAAMLQQAIEYVQSLQEQIRLAKEQGLVVKSENDDANDDANNC